MNCNTKHPSFRSIECNLRLGHVGNHARILAGRAPHHWPSRSVVFPVVSGR